VLSGTYWNAMGDDMEKGVMLKPGSVFALPANHVHRTWTTDEEVVLQINFTGPGGITFVNPADDPRKKPITEDRFTAGRYVSCASISELPSYGSIPDNPRVA